jgi:hypothetical protein
MQGHDTSCPFRSAGFQSASSFSFFGLNLAPHFSAAFPFTCLAQCHIPCFDEVRAIDEQEARTMARRLAKEEGIFAGTSSGMNVVAALQLARELGPGKTVATVAGDLYTT